MGTEAADDAEALVNQLLSAGVVELSDDGDGISLAASFDERVEECAETVAELDDAALREELTAVIESEAEVDALLDVAERSEGLLAEYLALARAAPDDFTHEDRLRVLAVLDALGRSPPRDRGSPTAFTPVHGDRLPFLLRVYQNAVVYIWLDDCPDCEEVRATFDDLYDEAPEDVAFLSVYGPDCSRLLQEEYGVPGGPATLFVKNGTVDSRLYGAQYEGVIESEIRTLRES
jgi:thiol-disulfide isomerase/thioredoxin